MRIRRRPITHRLDEWLREPVVAVGLGLVGLQLLFRAWALYPGWFYYDDFRLLYDAETSPLSLEYLLDPYDSQFMPLGRAISWLVASQGALNWELAASLTLAFQAAASLAALWMLTTLFGNRWGVLGPLAIYLTSAVTMPALMWWAVALNQLPFQVSLFVAVGAAVQYLRTTDYSWLFLTVGAMVFGLAGYTKAILIAPVLAFVALAYFSSGAAIPRVLAAVRKYKAALVLGTVVSVGYLWHYLTVVPQLFDRQNDVDALALLETMVGQTLAPGLFGGPWRWSVPNPPVALADAPGFAITLSWAALAGLVLYSVLRRDRAARSWVLFASYTAALYFLLLTTRAPVIGPVIGREYRYLTDAIAMFVICLALAVMPLLGATEPSAPRSSPLFRWAPDKRWLSGGVAMICATGMYSSYRYAETWHTNNPGGQYMRNLQADMIKYSSVPVANVTVPQRVLPGYHFPYNTTERLARLVSPSVRVSTLGSELSVPNKTGSLEKAVVDHWLETSAGPRPGCGWLVRGDEATRISLPRTAPGWGVWTRIGYLTSGDTPVEVRLGHLKTTTLLRDGLNSLFVYTTSEYDEVVLATLREPDSVCVDVVQVGELVPGGPL